MRRAARVVVLIVLSLAVACGDKPPGEQATTDLLYFEGPRGVSVLAAGSGTAQAHERGVPSTDWTSVVTADAHPVATDVEARNARSGAVEWTQSIEGHKLDVRVVSQRAQMVALTPRRQYHYASGRRHTTIVVAGRDKKPQTVELDGNYEPEAFSTDGNSVFLLEYLPPQAPNSYRVRRLDLTTNEVLGVYSVDAELQERMRGTARIQSVSPDGTYLYTLYTTGGGRFGPRRAFIHVLNLDDLWAHCIDLPEEFGNLREAQIGITVTPDSKRLFVNDVGTGAMAAVDTQSLEVLETATMSVKTSGYTPQGVHDGGRMLYLARGPIVSAIDTNVMEETETWTMPVNVRGLQLSADVSKLYVALDNRVVTLDASTGENLEEVDPPGIGKINRMGPTVRTIESGLSKINCAC